MLALSINMMFFDEPSSRFRIWTWSSWMRTVFSTMPSLAPAILSRKNRSHSASENVIPFRASSWVRRFAINWASVVTGRYSYAWPCNNRTSSRSRSASDWYAVAPASSGTNSATTVLSADTAMGS